MSEAIGPRAEPGSGIPPNGVAAPSKVAEGEVDPRVKDRDERFKISVTLVALNERIPQVNDPVAVLELQIVRFVGQRCRRDREHQRNCNQTRAYRDHER